MCLCGQCCQCSSSMTVQQFVKLFRTPDARGRSSKSARGAENGQEAIEKAQLLRPALIVTDLSMPLMNGLEETRILKNSYAHRACRSFHRS